jgi:hypothetical protein
VTTVYTFIAEEQADPACEWSLIEMRRVLEVSRSSSLTAGNGPPEPTPAAI